MYSVIKGGEHTAETTHILVNAGANIYIKNNDNKTVYDIAKEKNNTIALNILQQYKDNWIFTWTLKNKIQLKFWSKQNIKSVRDIHTSWKGDKHRQSFFSKLPWELIREYILPMTIDRRYTISFYNNKKSIKSIHKKS